MDNDVLLPYEYSRIAHISSLFILKLAIKLMLLNEEYLGTMFVFCYILTNLHWFNLKKKGIIRFLDILMVVKLAILGFYRASFYDCYGRYCILSFISIFAFFFNEYLNNLTLYKNDFYMKDNKYKNSVYFRSTFIHILFLHIFQSENACTVPEYCKYIY